MEIFGTFGIDWVTVVAQIINFLIILYVLKRFLYKPLFGILKKREDLAKQSIQKADESAKALEKAQEEERKIIAKAQETAKQIVSDAKEQASDIVKRGEENTKKQTDKMLKDAKTQIDLETQQAQAQLNKYVSKLAIDMLEKSISNVFTENEQTEIIAKATKAMQKSTN
jgi:F-type H+-transporting ATPase subunit b